MKTIATRTCVIDNDYTIYRRVVKLEDKSGFYQLHISTCKNFNVYTCSTFANKETAIKIMNQL